MKNLLKKILGFIIAPIFVSIYFYDRLLCVIIPLVNHFDIRIWLKDEEEIRNSLIRTIVVTISIFVSYGCYHMIKYFIYK